MWKKAGYYLFALCFSLFRIFPLQKGKVFFVATHDDGSEGNVGLVAEAIRRKMPDMKLIFLTKKDGIGHPFSFFFVKAYHLATSATIFMDNVFMPMAYTPVAKRVKVVQLWHGTGTIKKFGQDSDVGEVARISARANRRITHLIVSSEKTKKQYAGAFGVPEENVYVLGLPRTDLLLNEGKRERKIRGFYEKYPELRGKRCTIYAPTFRDTEVEAPRIALNLPQLLRVMGEDEVLLLRLHPFVAANYREEDWEKYGGRVRNMSDYRGVSTLLAVSDCLITDYSSIVYEYCLLDRPMVFYAYDLEDFKQRGRDFYEDYETLVPGPVVQSQRELEKLWPVREKSTKLEAFRRDAYRYLDENATERLLELIFREK